MRVFVDTHHIYIGKPSPLGLILVTLIIGLLSAAMLMLLLGAFLFLLPLAVLFITGRDRCRASACLFSLALRLNAPRRSYRFQRSNRQARCGARGV